MPKGTKTRTPTIYAGSWVSWIPHPGFPVLAPGRSDLVDDRRAVANPSLALPTDHPQVLLLDRVDWHGFQLRPLAGLGDGQLTQLAHTIARRVGRLLEREGLVERDTEQLELSDVSDEDDPMPDLVGHSSGNRGFILYNVRRDRLGQMSQKSGPASCNWVVCPIVRMAPARLA